MDIGPGSRIKISSNLGCIEMNTALNPAEILASKIDWFSAISDFPGLFNAIALGIGLEKEGQSLIKGQFVPWTDREKRSNIRSDEDNGSSRITQAAGEITGLRWNLRRAQSRGGLTRKGKIAVSCVITMVAMIILGWAPSASAAAVA